MNDYITIYQFGTDPILLAKLTGQDIGPNSQILYGHWEKKVIASPSTAIQVEFISDEVIQYTGFSATIHFTMLQNKKCESWMDMNNQMLLSPNYPNSYGNDIFCNHLITVNPNFHIILDFHEFDVSFLMISI